MVDLNEARKFLPERLLDLVFDDSIQKYEVKLGDVQIGIDAEKHSTKADNELLPMAIRIMNDLYIVNPDSVVTGLDGEVEKEAYVGSDDVEIFYAYGRKPEDYFGNDFEIKFLNIGGLLFKINNKPIPEISAEVRY